MAFEILETARKRLQEILDSDEWRGKKTYLRISVKGGGCSGFSYNLELNDESEYPIDPKDKIFELQEIRVVIDLKSYLYLNGVTLDYATQGLAGGFYFINPNAKHSCGCGSSFGV